MEWKFLKGDPNLKKKKQHAYTYAQKEYKFIISNRHPQNCTIIMNYLFFKLITYVYYMLYIGVACDTWLLERANNNLMYDAQKSFFVNCYWHSSIYLGKWTHHNTLIVRSLMTKPKVNPETSVHLDKRKVKNHLRKQTFSLSLSKNSNIFLF